MQSDPLLIPPWLWLALFPLSLLIHFVEEYWGGEGYPAYLLRLRGVSISNARFVVLQSVGMVLLIAAGIISTLFRFPELMITILGALILANGLSHSITAWRHGGYGPGLLTSVLLWMPFGALTLVLMFGRLSTTRFLIGAVIGLAINGLIAIITLRGGHIIRPRP